MKHPFKYYFIAHRVLLASSKEDAQAQARKLLDDAAQYHSPRMLTARLATNEEIDRHLGLSKPPKPMRETQGSYLPTHGQVPPPAPPKKARLKAPASPSKPRESGMPMNTVPFDHKAADSVALWKDFVHYYALSNAVNVEDSREIQRCFAEAVEGARHRMLNSLYLDGQATTEHYLVRVYLDDGQYAVYRRL